MIPRDGLFVYVSLLPYAYVRVPVASLRNIGRYCAQPRTGITGNKCKTNYTGVYRPHHAQATLQTTTCTLKPDLPVVFLAFGFRYRIQELGESAGFIRFADKLWGFFVLFLARHRRPEVYACTPLLS